MFPQTGTSGSLVWERFRRISINELKSLSVVFQGGSFLDVVFVREINLHCNDSLCRIDEIHQQLEEQLSVLSHFIDGVANLRPKGLSLSRAFRVTFFTWSTLVCHGPKVTRGEETACRFVSLSGAQFFAPSVMRT